MSATQPLTLTYKGKPLDMSPAAFGLLEPATADQDDGPALASRLERDGYLYLPGLLDRDAVWDTRRTVLTALAADGKIHPDHPLMDGVIAPGASCSFVAGLVQDNGTLKSVVYGDRVMKLFSRIFGEPARHFDYTWFRAKSPGGDNTATPPHMDNVYMSRGSRRLHTMWTPFGDVPYELGGLMVLEGSHRWQAVIETYGSQDVDTYCENDRTDGDNGPPSARRAWAERDRAKQGGQYSDDAIGTRAALGSRWLTTEYRMGDVLIFGMHTMHASLDNHTDRVRLSSDTRYQPAADPADPRWVGENPPAHGGDSMRPMIC